MGLGEALGLGSVAGLEGRLLAGLFVEGDERGAIGAANGDEDAVAVNDGSAVVAVAAGGGFLGGRGRS